MKRRSFLSFLGLAPLAIKVSPVLADGWTYEEKKSAMLARLNDKELQEGLTNLLSGAYPDLADTVDLEDYNEVLKTRGMELWNFADEQETRKIISRQMFSALREMHHAPFGHIQFSVFFVIRRLSSSVPQGAMRILGVQIATPQGQRPSICKTLGIKIIEVFDRESWIRLGEGPFPPRTSWLKG